MAAVGFSGTQLAMIHSADLNSQPKKSCTKTARQNSVDRDILLAVIHPE